MTGTNILGIIFADTHDMTIKELTDSRTMGSVPFGGRYRLIDFPLSNMVNSGISNVGVITKSNYKSLMDHLGSGREWDLARKAGGLAILPPFGRADYGVYAGKLDALIGISDYIAHTNADYVVLADSNVICNMSFEPVLKAHIEKGADMTMIYQNCQRPCGRVKDEVVLVTSEQEKVQEFLIDPHVNQGSHKIFLDMMICSKDFLQQLIWKSRGRGIVNFYEDYLQKQVQKQNFYAYEYNGYAKKISSIQQYYNTSIQLLDANVSNELFRSRRHIYTKVRDEAPVKYGLDCAVCNCLAADGCIIEGTVENCILFRGVTIAKGAVVRNSIIMQGSIVSANANLNYVITDKNVRISSGVQLSGTPSLPVFVQKGAVV